MKIQMGSPLRSRLLISITLLPIAIAGALSGAAEQPQITSVQNAGTNVLIEVAVPPGFQRITLESRSRLGDGTWAPQAVGQSDGSRTTLKFQLPCTRQSELIRVRADSRQALPSRFYKGPTSFAGTAGTGTVPGIGPT